MTDLTYDHTTSDAARVIKRAKQKARIPESEHLLLAIITSPENYVGFMLRELGMIESEFRPLMINQPFAIGTAQPLGLVRNSDVSRRAFECTFSKDAHDAFVTAHEAVCLQYGDGARFNVEMLLTAMLRLGDEQILRLFDAFKIEPNALLRRFGRSPILQE